MQITFNDFKDLEDFITTYVVPALAVKGGVPAASTQPEHVGEPEVTTADEPVQAPQVIKHRRRRVEVFNVPAPAVKSPPGPVTGASGQETQTTPDADKERILEAIKARAAEKSVTDVEHMKLCTNFILKLGMPKYYESFSLVGLTKDVFRFSQKDRDLHAAALAYIDKNTVFLGGTDA